MSIEITVIVDFAYHLVLLKRKKTMKNSVIWDVIPCGACKNRRFGGRHCLHYHGEKKQETKESVSSN
jgi:hypothetical protein